MGAGLMNAEEPCAQMPGKRGVGAGRSQPIPASLRIGALRKGSQE